jgi:hypothetical protein
MHPAELIVLAMDSLPILLACIPAENMHNTFVMSLPVSNELGSTSLFVQCKNLQFVG